tara:strand:- start:883 stop:1137 length:255 start_codon:yes stop_codon:yes gene_type:complete
MEDNAKKKMTPELRAATLDSVVSREIVQEILKFGVTQSQILKIIEVLAMELENRDTMLSIIECTKSDKATFEKEEKSSGLITDI